MALKLAIVILAGAVVTAQRLVDHRLGMFRPHRDAARLWSAEQVKALTPGFQDLMADLYWLRTVQYFGGQRAYAESGDFALVAPLVEIATTLDPRFEIAYRYGALFLAEPKPYGAGQPRQGLRLLEKGVRADPENWRLRQQLGFFHFIYLHDALTAARILNEASAIRGAPLWLKTLAARVASEGGHREASRAMWKAIFDEATEGPIKENARTNLAVLKALDGRDALQEAARRFEATTRRTPASLEELVSTLALGAVPADPSGVPYVYDAASGVVEVSPASRLYRKVDARR